MIKITMVGVSADERAFFEQKLENAAFYEALDLDKIDQETEVLSVFIAHKVDASVLERLPKLRLIACRSTGVNNIDLAAAKARGVVVANVPAYGSSTVAEYTFTLLLMLTRRMLSVLRETTDAEPDRPAEQGIDLHGKTMGVIGTGNIGMSVARIARAFGMNVLAYDLYPNQEQAHTLGFTYVSIDELLTQSDVVTLHIPYTKENHHFLNSERIAQLKPGAIVVNTARGELLDAAALLEALRQDRLFGAALDVLEAENLLDPDEMADLAMQKNAAPEELQQEAVISALLHLPNVIITNHNAYNTREAVQRINQTTVENIQHFLTNKQEVHTV